SRSSLLFHLLVLLLYYSFFLIIFLFSSFSLAYFFISHFFSSLPSSPLSNWHTLVSVMFSARFPRPHPQIGILWYQSCSLPDFPGPTLKLAYFGISHVLCRISPAPPSNWHTFVSVMFSSGFPRPHPQIGILSYQSCSLPDFPGPTPKLAY